MIPKTRCPAIKIHCLKQSAIQGIQSYVISTLILSENYIKNICKNVIKLSIESVLGHPLTSGQEANHWRTRSTFNKERNAHEWRWSWTQLADLAKLLPRLNLRMDNRRLTVGRRWSESYIITFVWFWQWTFRYNTLEMKQDTVFLPKNNDGAR